MRGQLTHVAAQAVRAGLMMGSGGNLAARSPNGGQCWITAAGSGLDRLGCSGFSLIGSPDGGCEVAAVPFDQPGSVELAVTAAEAVAGGINGLVLGHHGCSVLADLVELAHKRAVTLEEAARMTFAALLLTAEEPRRVPQVPIRFLQAVGRSEAQI